jgi:uncharacterized membrane protein YkvA (DUF1232 family)
VTAPEGEPGRRERWLARAQHLKRESYALYLAARDSRTLWYAKLLAVMIGAYAFSPIDLVPDPIPVLGQLDDLIIIPLGIWLTLRLIPAEVMIDCRAEAIRRELVDGPARWLGVAVVVMLWALTVALIGAVVVWRFL